MVSTLRGSGLRYLNSAMPTRGSHERHAKSSTMHLLLSAVDRLCRIWHCRSSFQAPGRPTWPYPIQPCLGTAAYRAAIRRGGTFVGDGLRQIHVSTDRQVWGSELNVAAAQELAADLLAAADELDELAD
jgi:hypothetical protein